jgi:hypothetical protein
VPSAIGLLRGSQVTSFWVNIVVFKHVLPPPISSSQSDQHKQQPSTSLGGLSVAQRFHRLFILSWLKHKASWAQTWGCPRRQPQVRLQRNMGLYDNQRLAKSRDRESQRCKCPLLRRLWTPLFCSQDHHQTCICARPLPENNLWFGVNLRILFPFKTKLAA